MRDEIPPTKPELRVLQVFGRLGIGGAETWLLSLLKYFVEGEDTLPVRVRTDVCLTSGLPGRSMRLRQSWAPAFTTCVTAEGICFRLLVS